MSAPATLLGMVDGQIPFVLTQGIGEFRCVIPVLPGGDGADTAPLEERTDRCRHQTRYLIGRAPTCEHHIRLAIRIASGISDDWYAPNERNLPPLEACP